MILLSLINCFLIACARHRLGIKLQNKKHAKLKKIRGAVKILTYLFFFSKEV